MLNVKMISSIFSSFLENPSTIPGYVDGLDRAVWGNIKTNQELWHLEDSARMAELGFEHVATAKRTIDKRNQMRNDLIVEMDKEIADRIGVSPGSNELSNSESPGMMIDRLAILFIKRSILRDLLSVIEEEDLHKEYEEKEHAIGKQIESLERFLDTYLVRLLRKEASFIIQRPVKIYNDERIVKYVKMLRTKS